VSQLIQLRRGTTAEWTAANPVLAVAEPGMDTTTGEVKFGDGVTAWSGLSAPYSAGALGLHTLITNFTTSAPHTTLQDEGLTVTVNDTAGRTLRFTMSLQLYAPGGANGVSIWLFRDGVGMRTWELPSTAASTINAMSVTFVHIETIAITHASSVYKLQIAADTNNTQVSSYADGNFKRQLLIEDLGVM
jgi:hypothetical protein